MPHLSLSLLGPFQATLDGRSITRFASNRVRALLAYLAVEAGQAHARETLAGLLWPGYADASALANLRQALANLRQALDDPHADPPFLLITREMIQFNPESDPSVDVVRLHAAVRARPAEPDSEARWQEATAGYRGPFLQGLTLSDSPAFEEWATLQREQSAREMLTVLQRLAALHEERGDAEAFQECAQRQVDLDPTQEEGQRQLMRALARGGQASAALAQYQSCRRVLAEQMGVEPAAETTALYERIRAGGGRAPDGATTNGMARDARGAPDGATTNEMVRGARGAPDGATTNGTVRGARGAPDGATTNGAAAEGREREGPALAEADEGPEAPRALFVAREEELAQLDGWLGEALVGRGRVGFVVGEPGSGKTALARECARRAMEQYPDLVVAWGNANAYAGLGDPYLPFLEVLGMLTADVEGQRAAGSMSREHARRLRGLFPMAMDALLDHALGLVDLFLPSGALLARARSLATRCPDGHTPNEELRSGSEPPQAGPVDAPHRRDSWGARCPDGHTTNDPVLRSPAGGRMSPETRLEEALQQRAALSAAAPVSQTDLFQQVTRFLQALARQQPLLLVLDDLQWADAASIALLFHLGRHLAGSHILVLGLYRPEEVAAGRDGQRHPLEPVALECARLWPETHLDLADAEGQRFVAQLVDSEPNHLGPEFRAALHRHTGGHALFTTELLRGLRERGDMQRDAEGLWVASPELDWERLPQRLEAVIAAHLGRLPQEWQELLTVASVEGEEFTAEVAARLLGIEEREVPRTLSGPLGTGQRLVRAIALQRLGVQRLSRYRFRHALFQEYLYGRLDEVERCRLHEEVGEALEALYGVTPQAYGADENVLLEVGIQEDQGTARPPAGERASPSPYQGALAPQLARHFRMAGLTEKALAYMREAVAMGFGRMAVDEVFAHCREALPLVGRLPDTPQRLRLERGWQRALALFLGNGASWVLPEALAAASRAYELARQIGPAQECASRLNLGLIYKARGDLGLACECAERAVALAQGIHPTLLIAARACWAQAQVHCGEFGEACQNMEAIVRPCLGTEPGLLANLYGTHVADLAHAGWALWCLGYPERALQVAEAVRQMGYVIEDNRYVIQALCDATCFTHQLRREVRAVQEAVDELYAVISEGRDAPIMRLFATLYRGWVQVHTGALEEGIATLRQGQAAWDAGFGVLRAHWRGYLAEALGMAGRAQEGLALLEEALAEVERTGDRFSLAETWRLKGELILKGEGSRTSPPTLLLSGEGSRLAREAMMEEREAAAEACFLKAIEVAREQEARGWELRATVSLARLWRGQGKGAQAREVLAAVYGWFTEGFDTPDLVEAKALLNELTLAEAAE